VWRCSRRPSFDDAACLVGVGEQVLRHSSRSLPLNDSTKARSAPLNLLASPPDTTACGQPGSCFEPPILSLGKGLDVVAPELDRQEVSWRAFKSDVGCLAFMGPADLARGSYQSARHRECISELVSLRRVETGSLVIKPRLARTRADRRRATIEWKLSEAPTW